MEKTKTNIFQKIQNESATILNAFFALFAVLEVVLEMIGWRLVPISEMLVGAILLTVIVLFFCLAVRSKEYTSKSKTVSCNLLPLTGSLFGLWAATFFENSDGLAALLAVGAVIAAMVIGLNQGDGKGIGALSKVLGTLIAVVILVILGFNAMIAGFGAIEDIDTACSTDGTYFARAYAADQGALGGDTVVTVRREKRMIPTPLGWISDVDEATVHVGEWGEKDSITISWKDDDTLLIGAAPVEMSEYFQ